METQLDHALAYASRGWLVFPVHHVLSNGECSCQRSTCEKKQHGKHPRTSNGVKDATADPAIVRTWWTTWPQANIGMACGADSGVFALDVDSRHSGMASLAQWQDDNVRLPDTLLSNTGGSGQHWIFAYPHDELPLKNRVSWIPGVDVKSDGGYIILPQSNHYTGGRYEWRKTISYISDPPLDLLTSIRDVGTASGRTADGHVDTVGILAGVPEGERDRKLFEAACAWYRIHIHDTDGGRAAVTLLVLEAARNCQPPFPEDQARKCIESALQQDRSEGTLDWITRHVDDDELFGLHDIGNAQRLIKEFGHDILYVPAWGWLTWNEQLGWQRGELVETQVKQLAMKVPDLIRREAAKITDIPAQNQYLRWAVTTANDNRLKSLLNVAQAMPEIVRKVDDFDAQFDRLACLNGIVNLRDGTIKPFERTDLFTRNTRKIYDANARSPEWEKFLIDATEGDQDIIDYMQTATGYSATGSNDAQCLFLISGDPQSGKSTFLESFKNALGGYAETAHPDTFMYHHGQREPEGELAKLAGYRAVSMSEPPDNVGFNEALVKRITGGDRITGRELYKKSFSFQSQMTLWIVTNNDPPVRDDAMWRRLKKIAFNHVVPQEIKNVNLKTIFEAQASAILSWIVKGAIKYYRDGKISEPPSVVLTIQSYKMDEDTMGAFLNETCVRDLSAAVSLGKIYETYQVWCSKVGERTVLPRKRFMKDLEKRKLVIDRKALTVAGYRVKPQRLTEEGVMSWEM